MTNSTEANRRGGGGGTGTGTATTEAEIEMEQLLPTSNNNGGSSKSQRPSTFALGTPPSSTPSSSSSSSSFSSASRGRSTFFSRLPVVLLVLFVLVGVCLTVFSTDEESSPWSEWVPWSSSSITTATTDPNNNGRDKGRWKRPLLHNMVPQQLVHAGIYDPKSDFVNPLGIRPTYWEPENIGKSWGPCFPPYTKVPSATTTIGAAGSIQWNIDTKTNNNNTTTTTTNELVYNKFTLNNQPGTTIEEKKKAAEGGGCRPGFLIIGAGKCGTSSLYHYLVDGHPRILPALEKQIHYFKYHLNKPLGWYYAYFPTTQSFLEHGGLMTGEASPGYLPYPSVVKEIVRLTGERRRDGSLTLPKIIVMGREPLDRMYSSYRYNYVQPTLEALVHGNVQGIAGHRPESEYQKHLFSLEDFVRTELKQLKRCLGTFGRDRPTSDTMGFGAQRTHYKWINQKEFKKAVGDRYDGRFDNVTLAAPRMRRRKKQKKNDQHEYVPPLIDLDEVCYGRQVSNTVFREQWSELQIQNPDKVILNRNLHLTQAMIGRGLYTYPLEWWYLLFDPKDIFFVCTEDLSNPTVLEELTLHLGLPPFGNFSGVVAGGAYNVGGHRGYDEATSWDEIKAEEHEKDEGDKPTTTNGIPIPEDLYRELQEFVNPMNERLFKLIGKRCNWSR